MIELITIDSTNNYAMQLIDADKAHHGMTITALTQTGGKGQRNNNWADTFGQSLLRYVFGDVYKLKPEGRTILTLRWGIFFFVLSALNEVVWRTQSTAIWVAFKVWATMPLTVIFAAFQMPVLQRYAPDHQVHEIVPPMDPLP